MLQSYYEAPYTLRCILKLRGVGLSGFIKRITSPRERIQLPLRERPQLLDALGSPSMRRALSLRLRGLGV